MTNILPFLFLFVAFIFITGLVRPYLLTALYKGNAPKRTQVATHFSLVLLGLLFGIGATTPSTTKEVKKEESERVTLALVDSRESASPEATPQALYKVLKVVDGDTIKVEIEGKSETIRLIGINTPETVDPRKDVQCYGKEASDNAKNLLSNTFVRLEGDSTQGERDKYGRLLRYVYLEDGRSFNQLMISDGFAHEYTFDSNPYKYQLDFKKSEQEARSAEKGLWSTGTCSGNTTQGIIPTLIPTLKVTPFPIVAQTPKPALKPVVTPTEVPQSTSSVYYRNCTAARAAGAAPVYVGDPGYGIHLDRDHDGIGCE